MVEGLSRGLCYDAYLGWSRVAFEEEPESRDSMRNFPRVRVGLLADLGSRNDGKRGRPERDRSWVELLSGVGRLWTGRMSREGEEIQGPRRARVKGAPGPRNPR